MLDPIAPRSRTERPGGLAALALGVLALAFVLPSCSSDSNHLPSDGPGPSEVASEWRTYGGSLARTNFNADEQTITRENASRLVPLWRFTTAAAVTASPIIAFVDVPGEGSVQTVFAPSWDGHLYALRADSGEILWTFAFKPHPGASYPAASSATVEDIDGRRLVFIGAGMTMYCLHAATGELQWQFEAGTGCTDCDSRTERNEVESSPAVFEGVVYFGMDINDTGDAKGGFFAVDARTGTLVWYFDLETVSTCRPRADDQIRRFDGYHSSAALGLPEDFFATREGCGFDRTGTSCGNIWSSAAIDPERRQLFAASSNCDTDESPDTPEPPPPMPPFDAAVFSLTLDGLPVWRWRPRDVDNDDLGFGAVPNLFTAEIGGESREVVGLGMKDGTYYLLDRDGTNELTGNVEPYWRTKVVPGGDIGGIISSAAVGEGKVVFSTAFGLDIAAPQRPTAWALNASDGSVLWSVFDAPPSYSPTTAIPGLAFMGSVEGAVHAHDTDDGEQVVRFSVGAPNGSAAVAVGGRVYAGGGIGERGGNPTRISYVTSLLPSPISAFCVAGTEGCPEGGGCNDGNTCTEDVAGAAGCENTNLPDGTTCTIGVYPGQCAAGECIVGTAPCENQGQCSRPVPNGSACQLELADDGTPCTIGGQPAKCVRGSCFELEP
jgi:outer membrane protein assembly factor BamB